MWNGCYGKARGLENGKADTAGSQEGQKKIRDSLDDRRLTWKKILRRKEE